LLGIFASSRCIVSTTEILRLRRYSLFIKPFPHMNHIINSLILYTLEDWKFTCAVTSASLICWMVMRHNLIFLGMHFAISNCMPIPFSPHHTFSSQREADVYPASMNFTNHRSVFHIHLSCGDTHCSRGLQQRILGPFSPNKMYAHLNVNVETTVVSVIDEPCDDYDMVDIESKGCDTASEQRRLLTRQAQPQWEYD
ncbi:hypothetical protein EV424DRAFT_1350014, partial [Suillus variegatus]